MLDYGAYISVLMLPIETILAVFPSAVEVGNATLQPLTLCHTVALEYFGIDLNGELDAGNAYSAAWIMSKSADELYALLTRGEVTTDGFREWADGIGASVSEVVDAANGVVNRAFATNVPGQSANGEVSFVPKGYGWPLEIAEALCHEYSMSFENAMKMPLARAFGMMACARVRNGGKAGGPDYYQRLQLAEINKLKRKEA